MKSIQIPALVALTILAPGLVAHADGLDVEGLWLTQTQTAQVEISDCDDGTPCGHVVWLDPASMREGVTPETARDENNPDPTLRERPALGLQILSGFRARRSDWRGGRIYDPETGKDYAARLKRLDDMRLQVKGCIGPICQTQVWNRVEPDPQ